MLHLETLSIAVAALFFFNFAFARLLTDYLVRSTAAEVPAPRGDPAADRPGHRAPGPRPEPDSRLAGGVPVFDVCGRHRGKAASLAALLDRGLPPAPVLLPRRASHGHRWLAKKNLTLT